MEITGTVNGGTFVLNLTPIIGGIMFGLWQRSWLAGISFALLLVGIHQSKP